MANRNQDLDHNTHPFVEEIDYHDVQKIEVVGKGSFGTVYKALWCGRFVAVKDIECATDPKAFLIEARQLSRVSHRNIVALYGACTKKPHVCLIMEYAEGGSLYSVLHCNPKPHYTAAHAMSWAKQCADGVAYLHAMRPKPLIHRDLKPPNLLLIDCGRILKICDFGTVTDKATIMTNNKGSAAWMAPEVFKGYEYTEKCDVFSWGIIVWEVLSREQPFKDMEYTVAILWHVHMGGRPPLIEGCPLPIERLMQSCWDPNPTNRPSMEYVVEIMNTLCKFFPGADQPLEYDTFSDFDDSSRDTLDSNQSFDDFYTHTLQTSNVSQLSQYLEPADKSAARWASPIDNSEPRIVAEDFSNNRPNILMRNGGLSNQEVPLPLLELEVDPKAWDDDLQLMIGNIPNSQGRERLSVTETNVPVTEPTTSDNEDTSSDSSLDLDTLLDPHLRPSTPVRNNHLSQQIFEEHKKMAKEYLKMQTEIAYTSQKRDELLAAMTPEEREERLQICKQLEEKESLLKFEAQLKRQLELIRQSNPQQIIQDSSNDQPGGEGWLLIPSNQ